jgi:hypothetical protein
MTIQDKLGILYAICDYSNRPCDNCAAVKTCRGEKRTFVIDLINEVKALIKERDEAVAELAALKENPEN